MTQTQLLCRSALLAPWQTQDVPRSPEVKSFSTSSWEQSTYDYDTYQYSMSFYLTFSFVPHIISIEFGFHNPPSAFRTYQTSIQNSNPTTTDISWRQSSMGNMRPFPTQLYLAPFCLRKLPGNLCTLCLEDPFKGPFSWDHLTNVGTP